MQIRIMLSNGDVLTSDYLSPEDLLEECDSQEAVDDTMGDVLEAVRQFSKITYLSMTIRGSKINFNPAHILWSEFTEDRF